MEKQKRNKIIYYVSTGLLTAMMLMSAGMYVFNNTEISKEFTNLGFPLWIIYPLATAKILGLIAIWTNKSRMLKEWAYAGFFFNFLLAGGAHIAIGDGKFPGALMALVLLLISYSFSCSCCNKETC